MKPPSDEKSPWRKKFEDSILTFLSEINYSIPFDIYVKMNEISDCQLQHLTRWRNELTVVNDEVLKKFMVFFIREFKEVAGETRDFKFLGKVLNAALHNLIPQWLTLIEFFFSNLPEYRKIELVHNYIQFCFTLHENEKHITDNIFKEVPSYYILPYQLQFVYKEKEITVNPENPLENTTLLKSLLQKPNPTSAHENNKNITDFSNSDNSFNSPCSTDNSVTPRSQPIKEKYFLKWNILMKSDNENFSIFKDEFYFESDKGFTYPSSDKWKSEHEQLIRTFRKYVNGPLDKLQILISKSLTESYRRYLLYNLGYDSCFSDMMKTECHFVIEKNLFF